jgi:hypothetical protein
VANNIIVLLHVNKGMVDVKVYIKELLLFLTFVTEALSDYK